MSSAIALGLNALCLLGMQLVWFEADQTSAGLAFFNMLVATVLLTASFAFGGAASGVLRATGVFFLLANVENAVCALPPTSSSSLWNGERKDTAYAGGVLVLISVFASFVAAYTNGFTAPAAGLGGRVASVRGLCFLLAAIFLLIASAAQWSWTQQCSPTSRPTSDYPIGNAVLILICFIFLIAVVYGDNNTVNISVFLASTVLLHYYASPIFDGDVNWPGQTNFRDKWRAAVGLSFIGSVLLLLSVLFTGKRGSANSAALPFDVIAFALAIAGAVCCFVREPPYNASRSQSYVDQSAAYAIVITGFNLLQGVLGLDAAPIITTFFATMALRDFDLGSQSSLTGYMRGGLQLCQIAVLLSVFFKAFPADKPLSSYVDLSNTKAVGFALVWGLLAMLKIADNGSWGGVYSICILLAIVTYKALSSGCGNWGRTAFYILSYFAVARSFPLTSSGQYFKTASGTNDYVNTLAWLSGVYFLVVFAAAGAPTACALDLNECAAAAEAPAAAAEEKPAEASNEPAAQGEANA